MNNFFKNCVGVAILFASIFACQKQDQIGSSLYWAHMPYQGAGGNWLIDAQPNAIIEVCGETKATVDLLKAAILKWGSVIGRDKYLKVVDCNTEPTAKHKIQIVTQNCPGVAMASPSEAKMFKCRDYATVPENRVVFHETGHLWGLCDLYQGGYEYCDKDPKNNSGVPTEDAVMLSGKSAEPLKDDIAGIKALAERTDIPANKIWKDFLANVPKEPAPEDKPPTTPATQVNADLFLAIQDIADDVVRLYISSPAEIKKVAMCFADKTICSAADAKNAESITFVATTMGNARPIFVSDQKIRLASGQVYTLLGWDSANLLRSAVEVQFGKSSK